MKRFLTIFILVAMMAGCRTGRDLQGSYTDSVRVVTVIVPRDSLVYLPADSSAIAALVFCDSMNRVVIEELCRVNGQMLIQSWLLKTDTLWMLAKVDSQRVALAWNERHTTIEKKEPIVVTKTITVTEKVKPAWMMALAYTGGASLLVWMLFLMIKLFK